jgi:hypothetical protein
MLRHYLWHGLRIGQIREGFFLINFNVLKRFCRRGLHAAAASLIGAVAFLASALLPPTAYHQRYGCLIVATAGAFASVPPLLGWISSNLFSTSAAGLAIALNVSFGAPGQIAGVWIYKADEASRGLSKS